jgi:FSR family fosmidomycin resistance protein-like MFS transporter
MRPRGVFVSLFSATALARPLASSFVVVLLAVEFLDELSFGANEAAWPALRSDIGLSYGVIGLLIAIPAFFSSAVEPVLGIIGDSRHRSTVIAGGGLLFAAGWILAAMATTPWMLLVALLVLYPASGAFVSLSQATYVDLEPGAHDDAMARWTLAGSVGVVAGPLALSLAFLAGLGWRGAFVVFAAIAVFLAVRGIQATRAAGPSSGAADDDDEEDVPLAETVRASLAAAKRPRVWRWLALLELGDLTGDVLLSFLALYLVDSAGASLAASSVAIAIWAGMGLAGDALLILVLRRFDGLRYLRLSAAVMTLLLVAFLLTPSFPAQVAILGFMGFFQAGWYAIPQARLYATLPGQSGTAVAVSSASGLVTSFVPAGLGAVAAFYGIDAVLWLLLAGPVAFVLWLPRRQETAIAAADVV